MTKKMTAKLIGESLSDFVRIEIYDSNDKPVWFMYYRVQKMPKDFYIGRMCKAFDCMIDCENVASFTVGSHIKDVNDGATFDKRTSVLLEYCTVSGWKVHEDWKYFGRGSEFVYACIKAGLIKDFVYTDDCRLLPVDEHSIICLIAHVKCRIFFDKHTDKSLADSNVEIPIIDAKVQYKSWCESMYTEQELTEKYDNLMRSSSSHTDSSGYISSTAD